MPFSPPSLLACACTCACACAYALQDRDTMVFIPACATGVSAVPTQAQITLNGRAHHLGSSLLCL
eukprot:4159952-Pleurochrysis_carterae.AAC.1